jgi:hypothetical protein
MALQPASLPLPFGGGLETQQDPKQVPTSRLIDLQNAVFNRATAISKRNGYRALGRRVDTLAMDYVTPHGLARRDDELLLFADDHALSYRPSSDTWSDSGGVASVVATDTPLARTGTMQTMPDYAIAASAGILGPIAVAAWEDSRGGVWTATLEASTGRILRAAAQLHPAGSRPRCVAVGAVLHVYCADAAAGKIMVAIVDPALPYTAPPLSVLVDDLLASNPSYDAEPTPRTNTPAAIAWTIAGGYRVGYVDGSGVIGSAITGHPPPGTFADLSTGAIAVAYGALGPDLAVLWTDLPNAARYRLHDAATPATSLASASLQLLGATCPRITGAWARDARTLYWAAERNGATADLNATWGGSVTSAGVASAPAIILGHGLCSRAFADDAHVYTTIARDVAGWAYGAVVRMSAGWASSMPVVARILPGGIMTGLPARGHLASVVRDSSEERTHYVPITYHEQAIATDLTQFAETGVRLVELDFDCPCSWQTAQLGRGLYLAGSAPQHYDGDRWAEAGFHCAAQATAPGIVAGSGGALTPSSTYLFVTVVEEIDAQGELHQGPPSEPVTVVLAGGQNRVTWQIPTYRLTSKRRVRIGIFRTEANDTSEDPSFFRVSSLDPSVIAGSNAYVANSTTVDTLPFVDDMSDATLITREGLYTNGGILPNDPPGWGGGVIVGGKNRLFFTDPSDPHLVRYSQEIADAFGVEFAAELSVKCDPFGGPIVGLGLLDGAVVIFKETAIYIFGGDGPQANPDLSPESYSFTRPEKVTSDVGCSDVHSIADTPIGLIFKSSKGVYLLGRDRQVVRIGNPVAAYDAQAVTRTTLLPDRTHIVLLTDDGSTLLYDYDHQQWSRFTNHLGWDAIVVAGAYYYLRTDGRVFRETPGEYIDDNSHIVMLFETAWIKLAGYLQGWQRIWWVLFIGTFISDHKLRVRWQLDYEKGWNAPLTLDVDANYAPSSYGEGSYGEGSYGHGPENSTRYQRRLFIGRRCQAIRFRVEDIETSAQFGASFELSEMLVTGGIVAGAVKLPPTRSG